MSAAIRVQRPARGPAEGTPRGPKLRPEAARTPRRSRSSATVTIQRNKDRDHAFDVDPRRIMHQTKKRAHAWSGPGSSADRPANSLRAMPNPAVRTSAKPTHATWPNRINLIGNRRNRCRGRCLVMSRAAMVTLCMFILSIDILIFPLGEDQGSKGTASAGAHADRPPKKEARDQNHGICPVVRSIRPVQAQLSVSPNSARGRSRARTKQLLLSGTQARRKPFQ
jgi:hypothetical protein